MDVEFIEFYPKKKLLKGLLGQAHIFLPEIGVELRGIVVFYNFKKKAFDVRHAGTKAVDAEDPNKLIDITYFCIRDIVERKLFLNKVLKVVSEGITKKYGLIDGALDISKMKFMEDEARQSEWMQKKFEYFKNQLAIRNIPTDRPSKQFAKPQSQEGTWKFKPSGDGHRDFNSASGYRGRPNNYDNRRTY